VAHGQADLEEFRARLSVLRTELQVPGGRGPFVAYTDGGCIGNPGPGGWAAAFEPLGTWDLWGHLTSTTNNRAEALGVLAALEWVPAGAALLVRADSELTVRILQKIYKARKNPDIWQEIERVHSSKRLELSTEWVPGHAGVPGNEHADWLSRLGATGGDPEAAARIGQSGSGVPAQLVGLVPHDDWERNFLKSIENQLRSGRVLSQKQLAIIERIRSRST